MDIVNKIKGGVHLDNSVYEQPEGSMRDSLNGVITDVGNGMFKWSPRKGNAISFSILNGHAYFTHCAIRDRLIVITLKTAAPEEVNIYEVKFNAGENQTATLVEKWSGTNDYFKFSFDHPVTAIWGFYESDEVQRIYFTDNWNQPRCINIGKSDYLPITIDEKMVDFSPIMDNVYGTFHYVSQSQNGAVKSGTHFFAWRYYNDEGYYTDWSYLSNPVQVTKDIPGSTAQKYFDYQKMQGSPPDSSSGKSVKIRIDDIDIDYAYMQVCVFYSNDMNISGPGKIIYDGPTTDTSKEIIYYGGEDLGTVTLSDLIEVSIIIDRCKDMLYAKKRNIIANIKERSELDIGSYMTCSVVNSRYSTPIDTSNYPGMITVAGQDKGLFGVPTALSDEQNHILRKGNWYRAIDQVTYFQNGSMDVVVVPAGNLFQISLDNYNPIHQAGAYEQVIVKKKYLKNGVGSDINTNYATEVIPIGNEYPTYKGEKYTHYLKGYPSGEKIRLGILFFDHTGRPFAIRHLRNTNINSGGIGDVKTKLRYRLNPIISPVPVNGLNEVQVNANINYLTVSGIDITDIKDEISGFMIVRAPIIHQYIGMGLLNFTRQDGNDIFNYSGYFQASSDDETYAKCYALYCPEDLFNLKNFTLQNGDELENIYYLDSYNNNENTVIGSWNYRGWGKRESNKMEFYQKLYISNVLSNGNTVNGTGAKETTPGQSHQITNITKIKFSDTEMQINPNDPTKLYSDECLHMSIPNSSYTPGVNRIVYGINADHSVVMLDIDEVTDGLKGMYRSPEYDPTALLVAVKRPNADPYGGYSDASIANSVYMSTGHYQEVNDAVLAEVVQAGRYIFDEIEIFGGDTFISLFDVKRHYQDVEDTSSDLGHTVIFPVESRINIDMRDGLHVARDRTYDTAFNLNGIGVRTPEAVLEEFNYNDGYSTDDIADYYIPLPFNFKLVDEFDVRLRYSLEKMYNEEQDSFRIFRGDDYLDLDTNKGAITNIRHRLDRIIYWQIDEVGYIPIYERALTQNALGQPVQLGVGGLFERYDQLIKFIGNSNHFGLIESPAGYHWYDARRKIFISITPDLQISKNSIVDGLSKFFKHTVPYDMYKYDNPLKDYGICGGYDPQTKMILYTFLWNDGKYDVKYTIGIDTTFNLFAGFHSIFPRMYFTFVGDLFTLPIGSQKFYCENKNVSYGMFHNVESKSYVTLVVKEKDNETKIFDNIEVIAPSNFFSSIDYSNSSQSILEVIADNRNYKFRNKRWFGSIPKVSHERINDGYLVIKFIIDEGEPYTELYELKTAVRKIY